MTRVVTTLYVWLLMIAILLSPAFGQQQQQKPSETAWQINNIVNDWVRQLEAYEKIVAQLQTQLAAVTKERDELKAKEPKQ